MSTRNTALTTGCAAIGALIGVQFWDLGAWRVVTVVAVGTVLGAVVALGLLTVDRRPRVRAATSPEPAPPPPTTPTTAPTRIPTPAATPAAPSTPTTTPNPAAPQAAPPTPATGRTWWTEARPTTVPADRRDMVPPAAHEVDRAVVAQCPRCGDFRLDLTEDGDTYAFRCRNPDCGNRWEWRADAPWPTTVVRRNLTG
ncbi:hypothetical protein AB0K14_35765 [Actinosynnema sp. NPDC050801]|uniref:hypothetical protein n=1 Tax=unclassified Actinosynnema TaxID=2637065 RepID=UPI0033E6A7BB